MLTYKPGSDLPFFYIKEGWPRRDEKRVCMESVTCQKWAIFFVLCTILLYCLTTLHMKTKNHKFLYLKNLIFLIWKSTIELTKWLVHVTAF